MNKAIKYTVLLVVSISILLSHANYAQDLKQIIRGNIIDTDANFPVIGANIIIVGSDPLLGSSTDIDGKFYIENVSVGRVTLKVSCMGYEEKIISNLLLTSTKELVLNISLSESLLKMEEIVIMAKTTNGDVLNEMATVSARAFSVEETKRYAGSFNDPARMVSSFAGVMIAPEGDNYISVRGNSPKGMQWRLEGVEIPNPNHFSSEGATGGAINALNSAMLANSDFLTSAFPAEYGNAFSGIYDMRLRTGNNQSREYAFSIGAIGTDITLEGPFKKGGDASYLVNYRYSTLELLENLNIVNFDGVPKYQDLCFKVNLPTHGAGSFSIFGLMGKSQLDHKLPSEENEDEIIATFNIKSELGVIGINHTIPLSTRTFLESGLLVTENGSLYDEYELNEENAFQLLIDQKQRKYTAGGRTSIHSKINVHHTIEGGINYTHSFYDFYTEVYDKQSKDMVPEQDDTGNAGLLQIYGTWKYRISENFTLISGLHYMKNLLNGTNSIEPRAGIKWQFAPNQSINFGFGNHSRLEPLPIYLARTENDNGTISQQNIGLGFPMSRHYVIGYQNSFTNNLMIKLEAYYQDLYDIPVEDDPNSSFSTINLVDQYTTRDLVNTGSGYNYGLELTLERYFADTYYFMFTGSLYTSKYTAMDQITRDTRYNGNYIANGLFGKEFIFDKKPGKSKILSFNVKFSFIGARRFSPIDLEESREYGYTRYDESQAYTLQGDDIFIANLGISYRINKRKTSQEIKLDIQNFTNNAGIVDQYYNGATDQIEYIYQLGMIPNLMYTIEF